MVIEINRKSDFEYFKIMKELYPNLGNGYRAELSLCDLAQKIKNFNEKPYFQRFSVETIKRIIRFALVGVEYNGIIIDGLLGEDKYKEIYLNKVRHGKGLEVMKNTTGYVNWKDIEKEFVINKYNCGITPREISKLYSQREDFFPRGYSAISSFLDSKRKEGIIGKQRISWNGDLGFFALSLLKRYGKSGNYLVENVDNLNQYFYNGENVLTKSKLNNFYNRHERKLEQHLRN